MFLFSLTLQYFLICDYNDPADLPHPSAAPHFVTFWVCLFCCPKWLCLSTIQTGARDGTDGWGTVLHAGRSWVRFPMV
jgi:hypothetical protein